MGDSRRLLAESFNLSLTLKEPVLVSAYEMVVEQVGLLFKWISMTQLSVADAVAMYCERRA